jgi:hypothetical protein
MPETFHAETGLPDIGPVPEGYITCSICKTDKMMEKIGNLNSFVKDKYEQLVPPPSSSVRQQSKVLALFSDRGTGL